MAGEPKFAELGASSADLDTASRDRLADAEVLFAAHPPRNSATILIALYSLEIRLKVLICERLELNALPRPFQIHDLDGLLTLTGLSKRIDDPSNLHVKGNWIEIVRLSKNMNELRYGPESDPRWSREVAENFMEQLRDIPNGVLPWLMKQSSNNP